jgi:DNA-binding transcriptional regulator YdaS (Cro superfamily)
MPKQGLTKDELIQVLSKACDAAGGASTWAKSVGISKQYVSDVLNGRTQPGEAIAHALGYERQVQVTYTKKDIWEENG